MNDSSKLVAENGTFLVDNSSTGPAYLYIVQEDTVVTELEETGDVDVMSEHNLTGKTLTKGYMITPRREHITKIVLSSGSVNGVRG